MEHCYTPVLEHCDIPLLEQTQKLGVAKKHIAPWELLYTAPWAQGHIFPWVDSYTSVVEHCGNALLVPICIAAWEHFHISHVEHTGNVLLEQIDRPVRQLSLEQFCILSLEHCDTSAF